MQSWISDNAYALTETTRLIRVELNAHTFFFVQHDAYVRLRNTPLFIQIDTERIIHELLVVVFFPNA